MPIYLKKWSEGFHFCHRKVAIIFRQLMNVPRLLSGRHE